MMNEEEFDKIIQENGSKLKSFLYRFVTSKEDAEDIAQDAFVKAWEKIDTFTGKSSFKTWLFSIAVNLAKDHLRAKKRWSIKAQDNCKSLIGSTPELASKLHTINAHSEYGHYEINEHIDFCFTCISKSLLIEQQIAIMLAEIYDFKVQEISEVLGTSVGKVKHLLYNGRTTMQDIYQHRCSLINKKGVCHQCSELNGFNNKKAETQQIIAGHELAIASKDPNREHLFHLRSKIVKAIDPLNASGRDLHDFLLECTHKANHS
jgi:RNA polymerase sigma-70 factor (ECF subfamily)